MIVVSVEQLRCTIENEATRGRGSRVETRQFLRLKRVMTSPKLLSLRAGQHNSTPDTVTGVFSLSPYDNLDHNATNDSQGLDTFVGLLPGMNFRCASGLKDIRPASRIHRPHELTRFSNVAV